MSLATDIERDPDPIQMDSRPCGLCGLKIDRHEREDTPEGPEFYCLPPDEMDLGELERYAELMRQVEIAAAVRDMELNDPRDQWKHTGEHRPAADVHNSDRSARPTKLQPRSVPQSTVDGFKYVVSLGDPAYLAKWLHDHSDVAPALLDQLAEAS
jgi:hypothetical protein